MNEDSTATGAARRRIPRLPRWRLERSARRRRPPGPRVPGQRRAVLLAQPDHLRGRGRPSGRHLPRAGAEPDRGRGGASRRAQPGLLRGARGHGAGARDGRPGRLPQPGARRSPRAAPAARRRRHDPGDRRGRRAAAAGLRDRGHHARRPRRGLRLPQGLAAQGRRRGLRGGGARRRPVPLRRPGRRHGLHRGRDEPRGDPADLFPPHRGRAERPRLPPVPGVRAEARMARGQPAAAPPERRLHEPALCRRQSLRPLGQPAALRPREREAPRGAGRAAGGREAGGGGAGGRDRARRSAEPGARGRAAAGGRASRRGWRRRPGPRRRPGANATPSGSGWASSRPGSRR